MPGRWRNPRTGRLSLIVLITGRLAHDVGKARPSSTNEPTLEATPISRIEKLYDSSILTFLPTTLVIATLLDPLTEKLGFWLGSGAAIAISVAPTVIVTVPVIPYIKRRRAMDAEQGIFECSRREPGSALKGRWAPGYAKAEPSQLLVQAKTGMTGRPAGRVEVYSAPTPLGGRTKAPWAVFPKGKILVLNTDKGVIELAATPTSLVLLKERCQGGQP
jgi:hypothetical protein